jgi:hypothetical protein
MEITCPAILVDKTRAAEMLSISRDTFRERVEPELEIVRLNGRKLIPVKELETWAAVNAEDLLSGV